LTSLSEQIYSYQPTCDCICAIQCTCGAATNLRKYKEQDRVIKFLKGLNEQFSHVHSQIMLLDPLPSLDKTFSLVLGQERQLSNQFSIDIISESQSMALQVQNSKPNREVEETTTSIVEVEQIPALVVVIQIVIVHTMVGLIIIWKHVLSNMLSYPSCFQSKNHKFNINNVDVSD
jgi:hypothetical protein